MPETRKLAAILAADVVGYSRLAAADEDRILARLRALRSDLIDPTIAVHHGRVVKRTGDGALVEFRSVVDAVRCAIEVQNGMIERNAGLPPERRIEFRIGVHLGDVVEESDGDLMGDGVNIAARLESICAPGAICLSEPAYWQVKSRLDLAVADLGDQNLKNIPEPVHVFSLEVGRPATAKPQKNPSPPKGGEGRVRGAAPSQAPSPILSPLRGERGKRSVAFAAIAALIVIAAFAAWHFLGRAPKLAATAPAHLSIVVLPFANLSNDPKQDYFADGITENLTTDLSRIRNSFVIARNTAFTFKGKNVDAKEIGKNLGVRYVLEGSVARDGNRVRVNAQLIDAESGAHLWADRFEEDLADLFKLQDDVVARLANTLGYELVKAEAEKGAHSTNPDAIDLTFIGRERFSKLQLEDKAAYGAVRTIFEQALRADPNHIDALEEAGYLDAVEFCYHLEPQRTFDKSATDYLARVLALAPQDALAHFVKSYLLFCKKQLGESVSEAKRAIEIDPNLAWAYAQLSADLASLGDSNGALAIIDRALTLSPRDHQIGYWHFIKGKALLFVRRYPAAVHELREAKRDGFETFIVPVFLASALALVDRPDDAKAELARARTLEPRLTIAWLKANLQYPDVFYDGLRKAGIPEQ